uniref:Uncharacterized protein n=1 Tax=Ixodes ricinus TaxID=34613 RepID=A0A0K8RJF1_IXORI
MVSKIVSNRFQDTTATSIMVGPQGREVPVQAGAALRQDLLFLRNLILLVWPAVSRSCQGLPHLPLQPETAPRWCCQSGETLCMDLCRLAYRNRLLELG